MKYYKLSVVLSEERERLTRTILVNRNVNLYQLGWIIGKAFGCSFHHEFMFMANFTEYASERVCNNSREEEMYDYKRVRINELELHKKDFMIFIYDLRYYYMLRCVVEDNAYNLDEDVFAKCLDGTGECIFEDAKQTLLAYLRGKIDKLDDSKYPNPTNLPTDYDLSKFDSNFDIDKLNEIIKEDHSEDDYGLCSGDVY